MREWTGTDALQEALGATHACLLIWPTKHVTSLTLSYKQAVTANGIAAIAQIHRRTVNVYSFVALFDLHQSFHPLVSDTICICMASPIKDIIWFFTLQLKYEALRGAFKNRSDVCLSAASTRSLKAALKTLSLQSVSFSENAPASPWPLNGISWRPKNAIVLMIWERRFRFSSTAFCRLLFKAFRTSLDLSASACTRLSNMAVHNLW